MTVVDGSTVLALDEPDVRLYLGDSLEALRVLEAASVDAVVTDPPYGLEFMGKAWDSFRVDTLARGGGPKRGAGAGHHGELQAPGGTRPSRVAVGGGTRGETSRCVGCGKRDQFRKPHTCPEGTEWRLEIVDPHAAPPTSLAFGEWCRRWALEVYRVVKPGAHVVAFGAPRTWHRLACGLEDAGFEIRDAIAWLHAEGYPKSATSLKPAWEPAIVARRPFPGSETANRDAWGVGGLEVDGGRVPMSDADRAAIDGMTGYGREGYPARPGVALEGSVDGSLNGGRRDAAAHPGGRWPANVVLDAGAAADLGAPARFYFTPKVSTRDRYFAGRKTSHPTVKPLDLMRWVVRIAVPPGGVVLDPFVGSGTTLQAARDEGRRAIGVERDPASVADTIDRLAQLTLLAHEGDPSDA